MKAYKPPIGVQAKPKSTDLKISMPKGKTVSKVTWLMKLGKNIAEHISPSESQDYSSWSENIRKGTPMKNLQSYKKGGKVKKTGLALVHKGEIIIPKKKFVKEHKKLVKVLKSGKKHKMKKEAHKQEKELKDYDD